MDSATAGNRCEGTGWAEKVTASNSVRSVYLSLTTHLIVAIILTLWAISPESQSSRLSPVIIDFGTESEQEWGETNGDDNTATLLTEADEKDDPLETSEERSDSSEEEVTAPDENQTNQQMQTADPNKEMAPDSPVSEKTATKAQPSLRQVKPKEQQDNKNNDMQRGGGSRATASSADAKVALSQRSGAARGETARARVVHQRVRPQLNVDFCGLHGIKQQMAPGCLNIPTVSTPLDALRNSVCVEPRGI